MYNILRRDSFWLFAMKGGAIMPTDKREITKEMLEKAMQCKDADELVTLAKTGGIEMTKEEAEAYLAELADFELDSGHLKSVAGGGCYADCDIDYCVPHAVRSRPTY